MMRRLFHTGCVIVLFAIAQSAAGVSPVSGPKTVKATYSAYMNGMAIGAIIEQFEADGGTYRIVSETRPTGLAAVLHRQRLRFTSRGELTREGLRPTHFEGRRNPNDPPQVAADFDWAQGQLQMKYNSRIESIALTPGAQDRLSIMYQFMFVQPDRARPVEFWMTNGRKFDLYRYRLNAEVELETALGRLKTLHFVKQRDPGESHAEVWVSTQHHNVPVKVVIVEKDGMRYEQLIQTLELRD